MSGQHDCECLKTILEMFGLVRYLNVVKNSQYVKVDEPAEQTLPILKLASFLKGYGISLTMAVDLLLAFAKDNMSARKTILCVEYIKQILDASQAVVDEQRAELAAVRKHIFIHLKPLVMAFMRPPQVREAKTPLTRVEDKLDTRSETETDSAERLSTRSDQFSTVDTSTTNLALHFLKPPVFS